MRPVGYLLNSLQGLPTGTKNVTPKNKVVMYRTRAIIVMIMMEYWREVTQAAGGGGGGGDVYHQRIHGCGK